MVKSISHLSGKQKLLCMIVIVILLLGIIQVIPIVTNASMQQETGNAAEVSVETHDDVSMFE